MRTKHHLTKIDGDLIQLDKTLLLRVDPADVSRMQAWSAPFDEVEVDEGSRRVQVTNVGKRETVRAVWADGG